MKFLFVNKGLIDDIQEILHCFSCSATAFGLTMDAITTIQFYMLSQPSPREPDIKPTGLLTMKMFPAPDAFQSFTSLGATTTSRNALGC